MKCDRFSYDHINSDQLLDGSSLRLPRGVGCGYARHRIQREQRIVTDTDPYAATSTVRTIQRRASGVRPDNLAAAN